MGIYINPQNMQKEDFLTKFGKQISEEEFKDWKFVKNQEDIPVCLIQNPYFTAAAVAYDKQEVEDCTYYSDTRPKEFYLVNKELLLTSNVLEPRDIDFLRRENV